MIAIDGSTGVVTADEVRLIAPQVGEAFAEVLSWADELRRLGVRANADTAEDAARARELGAEGIGLCRTEHMFFGSDRDELVREMFIAGELWRRGREQAKPAGVGKADDPDPAEEEFARALERLGEIQQGDFVEIFRAMSGLPVTIRLLDPPIHEFIEWRASSRSSPRPSVQRRCRRDRARARCGLQSPASSRRRIRCWELAAPGSACCCPGSTRCRCARWSRPRSRWPPGEPPEVEIMMPLIAFESELEALRELVDLGAERVIARCWHRG